MFFLKIKQTQNEYQQNKFHRISFSRLHKLLINCTVCLFFYAKKIWFSIKLFFNYYCCCWTELLKTNFNDLSNNEEFLLSNKSLKIYCLFDLWTKQWTWKMLINFVQKYKVKVEKGYCLRPCAFSNWKWFWEQLFFHLTHLGCI